MSERPIGVFDSGKGGLSVLRALEAELPEERFVYFADSEHAPYGERGDAFVAARTLAVVQQLRDEHAIRALVIACNTATAAAIHMVRERHPDLVVVGVEPALKPAALQSRTKRVAVMATRGTLASEKYRALRDGLSAEATFVEAACDGLADAIERSQAAEVERLCGQYLKTLGPFGLQQGQADTLVLGCTHYPFAMDVLRGFVGPAVSIVDTGVPVARQLRRRLEGRRPQRGPL